MKDLLKTLLSLHTLNLQTKKFVEDLNYKLEKFGSLSDPQKTAVLKICSENGVIVGAHKQESTIQIIESKDYEEIKGSCGICFDGLVLCSLRENNNKYVFVCACDVGRKRPEKFPKWFDHLQNKYLVEKVEWQRH